MRFLLLSCFVLLAGCEKYYLSLRQQKVDATYLASSRVGTPDPEAAHPPLGQKLIIDWAIPKKLLAKKPEVVLYILYKDHSQKKLVYPIRDRHGNEVYSLLNDDFEATGGLLTYRAEIVLPGGEIYRDWKHQLWVNLITVGS
jgi:hypothetical protein